jgi:hypothetical protein
MMIWNFNNIQKIFNFYIIVIFCFVNLFEVYFSKKKKKPLFLRRQSNQISKKTWSRMHDSMYRNEWAKLWWWLEKRYLPNRAHTRYFEIFKIDNDYNFLLRNLECFQKPKTELNVMMVFEQFVNFFSTVFKK